MGHGKETPRQKMIGMMYLVLTALLALNVSADILNAFILVDKSLGKTSENFKQKNEDVYTKFQAAYIENKAKVAPLKEKADQVKVKTQKLIDEIYNLKTLIVSKADGPESKYKSSGYNPQEIKSKDNNNIPSEVMILNGKGEELRKNLEEYKKFLESLITNKTKFKPLIDGIERCIDLSETKADDGQVKNWEETNFHHLPLAAVTTMLTKIQADLRNCEGDVLSYLMSQIDANSFKFTKIEAVVKANSSYLLKGQKYEAEVFIAASDTSVKPEILVGGRQLEIKNGKGIYNGGTESVGLKNWGGVIKLKSPASGEIMEFPFKTEYQVGEPGLVVSPTKMNVFYVGVDNPVEVSVSGVPDDKVKVSISNGEIRKVASGYVVRVKGPSGGEASVKVSADFGGGSVKDMGAKKFRVKTVPDPKPFMMIGDKKLEPGMPVPAEKLAYGNLEAVLENFDFDLKFKITKFTLSTTIKGFSRDESSEGGKISANQVALIRQAGSGSKIYFEGIVAKGPDGTERKLGTLGYKLK